MKYSFLNLGLMPSTILAKPQHLLAACTLAMASLSAHAQSVPGDEMGQFLVDRGLVARLTEQVSQASSSITGKASALVVSAMGFLGVPYKWGGNSFEQGFDCSGFVKALFEQSAGYVLPRRSSEQAAATQPIDKSQLQPGDLVFFNTMRSAFSHVGIYVGEDKFIHSPRGGAVVRLEDMRLGYWSSRFDGARRVATP